MTPRWFFFLKKSNFAEMYRNGVQSSTQQMTRFNTLLILIHSLLVFLFYLFTLCFNVSFLSFFCYIFFCCDKHRQNIMLITTENLTDHNNYIFFEMDKKTNSLTKIDKEAHKFHYFLNSQKIPIVVFCLKVCKFFFVLLNR